MGRRALLLVAAILLAAVGTGLLFLYATADGSPLKGSSQSETTTIMVPTADIPEGTPVADDGQFRPVSVDKGLAAQGRYVTKDGFNRLVGQVATQRLYAYNPVTADQFGGAVTGSSGITLVPNTMNVSVEMDDPAKVGDFLYPGAKVAVWVLDPDTKASTVQHQVEVVLPEVTVVTTGSQRTIRRPSDDPTASAVTGQGAIVTLQVTQEQAAKLLLAKQSGELYFTLLGSTKASTQTYSATGSGG